MNYLKLTVTNFLFG